MTRRRKARTYWIHTQDKPPAICVMKQPCPFAPVRLFREVILPKRRRKKGD